MKRKETFTVYSYGDYLLVKQLCKKVKICMLDSDFSDKNFSCQTFENYLENYEIAKKIAAKKMAKSLPESTKQKKIFLVPIPNHNGEPEYTLEIADLISDNYLPNSQVLPILFGARRQTTRHDAKVRKGVTIEELNLSIKGSEQELDQIKNGEIIFVDNVLDYGKTFENAVDTFRNYGVGEDCEMSILVIGKTYNWQRKSKFNFIEKGINRRERC